MSILKEIRLTEKANVLSAEHNQYVFEVCSCANKFQIAQAVSSEFGVKVLRVNVINQRGKVKLVRAAKARKYTKASDIKKAIVFLAKGEKIEIA